MPSEPSSDAPDLAAIRRAADRLGASIPVTPLIASAVDSNVVLKLDALNRTGSFKIRGATNAILARLDAGREHGVVCCSTGNHGRALATAAALNGVNATICVSQLVPPGKIAALKATGADICITGRSQDDAQHEVDRLVSTKGLIEIPPFDHPDVIAGQGTVGLELLKQHPDLAMIAVPLSGGGLAGGIALAAKAMKPDIRIVAISMERGAAMAESIAVGKPVEVEEIPSMADSLGGGIGLGNRYTFDLCQRLVDDVIVVSETDIYQGLRSVVIEERLMVEGAAAVCHAALLAGKLPTVNGPTAFILSGRNAEPDQISDVLAGRPVTLNETTRIEP